MTSPVDVANMALDNIGARFSITSLSPPSPPPNATVVARHYQPKIDALFRTAHWNCARRQTNLTLLKAAAGTPENASGSGPVPPYPWQYEYALPPDCLKVRFLLAQAANSGAASPSILGGGVVATPAWTPLFGAKFVVAIDNDLATPPNQINVILTDLEFAQAVYTARIQNPDLWDPHFLLAATASLGAWLVNPLARNAEVLKEQIAIASSVIQQARISDGNEGVTSVDHYPDWMAVRGATGFGYLNDPSFFQPWDGMAFPGGVFV